MDICGADIGRFSIKDRTITGQMQDNKPALAGRHQHRITTLSRHFQDAG